MGSYESSSEEEEKEAVYEDQGHNFDEEFKEEQVLTEFMNQTNR